MANEEGQAIGASEATTTEAVEEPPSSGTRDRIRNRRKRAVRARTISVKRMTQRELELGRLLFPEQPGEDYVRPTTRAECKDGPRPCPFVSCTHHLYLDVQPRTGAIKLNFPDLEVEDMTHSCALDVADQGGSTLEDIGAIMNLTRERIRQVEVRAMARAQAAKETFALRDFADEGPVGKRRLPMLVERPEDDEGEGEGEESYDGPFEGEFDTADADSVELVEA
jgi:hypothetical protein